MSILVDTNVLLRRAQPDHPSHTVAVESVARLLAAGEVVYFTPQNIAEFWNVATRPAANNGLGFPIAAALVEVSNIERALTLLPESPASYAEWKRLVVAHNVLGTKVHDTRLVAAMNVHGVKRILTFNTGDFNRFAVEAINPAILVT
jgi:predicted nucleic acid-binding protein